MTNKIFLGVAVVGVIFLGFIAFKTPVQAPATFGTAAAYQALNNQNLLTELNAINTDATAVRLPLSGILQTSTPAIGFPAISASSSVSTTTLLGFAASLGDTLLIAPGTTSPGFYYVAHVSTASTTNATAQISAINSTGAVGTPSSTVFNVTLLPFATFKAPAALTQ